MGKKLESMSGTTMKSSSTNGGTTLALTHKRMTSMVSGTFKSGQPNDEYHKLQQYTNLTVTKMTFQQALKWFIQIVLLILYHAVIFWVFPLVSNDAIYGTPYCNKEAESTFKRY